MDFAWEVWTWIGWLFVEGGGVGRTCCAMKDGTGKWWKGVNGGGDDGYVRGIYGKWAGSGEVLGGEGGFWDIIC